MSCVSSVSTPVAYQPPKPAAPPEPPKPLQTQPPPRMDSDGDNDGSRRVDITA
jgi:hypothetical protein